MGHSLAVGWCGPLDAPRSTLSGLGSVAVSGTHAGVGRGKAAAVNSEVDDCVYFAPDASQRTVACFRVGLTGPRTPPADADSAQQAEKPASTAEDEVDRVNLTDPKFVVWFLTVPVVLLVAWAHTLGFL